MKVSYEDDVVMSLETTELSFMTSKSTIVTYLAGTLF